MARPLVPKKFLCRYELKLGAKSYAILMIIVNVICVIATVVDMLSFASCEESKSLKRSAYAFCIITIIYSIFMVAVHGWLLWAIGRNKSSVVLVWVAMTGLWLIQCTVLLIVLLCLYIADTNFLAWLMCLLLGIVGFVICVYGVLIGYGLWVEMKNQGREPEVA